jgi:DNA-binding MarR family transcriptional regulator
MADGRATRGLDDFTGYLLRLAHTRAHQLASETFPDGPHPREYAVLAAIAAAGPLSQQRLAERLHVNRTLMVAVADALERRGLVERRRDPADRRSYALHVTPAGSAELERLHGEIERADRRLTERLDEAERARLNELLRALMTVDLEHVPEPLGERTGFLVARAHFASRDRANELLQPLGIVVRHVGLMSVLDAHGPSSQQALARRLEVSPTMITQMVDEVEARGLAERRPNPADRRSHLVTLTPDGKRKLTAARRVAAGYAAELSAPIGEEGDRELRALLRKLVGSGDVTAPRA